MKYKTLIMFAILQLLLVITNYQNTSQTLLSFDLLEQHKDEDGKINEILRISLIDNEKRKNDPYICIPEHYHSIPDWISKVIDIDYAADKLLMPFRQLLDAFGVYVVDVRGGFRPSNLAYI